MPSIGQSAICGSIIPNISYLRSHIYYKRLSPEAKRRLKYIEYYYHLPHPNKSLTCRHFGISRSCLDKWLKRFNPRNLGSLESHSTRPHHVRQVQYDQGLIAAIKEYRKDPETCFLGAKKLATNLYDKYITKHPEYCVSPATIGRIIKKYNFYYHPTTTMKHRSKCAEARNRNAQKKRKPAGLRATAPRQIIQFDMKHITFCGQKYYAMCAIDEWSKDAVIHVCRSCTSRQAKIALEKVAAHYGTDIIVLNDNGSENMGEAWDYLKEQHITQLFTHPRAPKEKPEIERFIGSFDRECLMVYQDKISDLSDLQYYTAKWLNTYHFVRPHDSLKRSGPRKYLLYTPAKFCATMGLTISAVGV